MKKTLSFLFAALLLVGAGCGSATPNDGAEPGSAPEAKDTMSAAMVTSKLKSAGIDFTEADDKAKRLSVFSPNNQPAIDAITKYKFGSTSAQLSVVDLNDASRKGFVDADLLSLYNQVKAADAGYMRSYAMLSVEDDDTSMLLIYKNADAALAKQIEGALK